MEPKPYQARTIIEAWQFACDALSIEGCRSATIKTTSGAEVHASLYDGEDWARDAKGRDVMHVIHRAYRKR